MNPSKNSTQAYNDAIELVALSCLESPEDQELFILHPPIAKPTIRSQRQDEKGYGADLQTAITSALDWILSIASAVPEGITQDAVKFWLYTEIYKRLSSQKHDPKLQPLIKKIRSYLEKQIK